MNIDQAYDELYGCIDTIRTQLKAVQGIDTSAIGALTSSVALLDTTVSGMREDLTAVQNRLADIPASYDYEQTSLFHDPRTGTAPTSIELSEAYSGFDAILVGMWDAGYSNVFEEIPVDQIATIGSGEYYGTVWGVSLTFPDTTHITSSMSGQYGVRDVWGIKYNKPTAYVPPETRTKKRKG